jgi:D-tyrosyl-tRNA(Tyr) deacylase
MVISQFTLFGNMRKGSRPSFNNAGPPEMATPLYETSLAWFEERLGKRVARGFFWGDMEIDACNDGPVTLVLDTHEKRF